MILSHGRTPMLRTLVWSASQPHVSECPLYTCICSCLYNVNHMYVYMYIVRVALWVKWLLYKFYFKFTCTKCTCTTNACTCMCRLKYLNVHTCTCIITSCLCSSTSIMYMHTWTGATISRLLSTLFSCKFSPYQLTVCTLLHNLYVYLPTQFLPLVKIISQYL